MSEFMIRVGDQDDYHREDMDGLIERLRMSRVRGPLLPYICSSRWASPEMQGKVVGVESKDCRGPHNYISLFGCDKDGEYERSITDEELAELNSNLSKIKDDYPDGECPDCGEEIPDTVWKGEACENCGHVFTGEVETDDR